jgi:ubiquinone biosynthesis protein
VFGAIGHILRLMRAGFVLAREGVFAKVDPFALPSAARAPLALARLIARRDVKKGALAIAVARLGPSYVKLGQFLATRADIIGPAAVRDLEMLQDRMASFPRSAAIATVEAALGKPIGQIFSEFGEAMAAASIAQVHRALIRDAEGERALAVKVLRPGIERLFRRDLSDMLFAARLGERYFAEARRLKLIEVVETLARTVRMEMDFRLEAAAASEFGENVVNDADFRVPAVDWDRTSKEVLTLEWVDGITLSNLPALQEAGFDLPKLGRTLFQSFLRHALRDGFFHADMHQGNLFVDRTGRLAAVDFGIMGRLGLKEKRFLAEAVHGFIIGDYLRVAEVHFEAGYVPKFHKVEDFAQSIRAIGEPIRSRTAEQISMAKLLTLLFENTALFDMRTRPELVLLQKTMVVVEGVARTLDPKLDMWSTAAPVVRSWVEENLGPIGKLQDAGRTMAVLGRAAMGLPELLARAETIAAKLAEISDREFEWPAESMRRLGGAEARQLCRTPLALWLIAALMALALVLR